MARTFTGWHMATILVAFFGVIIAVNVVNARYASASEFGRALSSALGEMIEEYKSARNFHELQIAEMIFFCQLRNQESDWHYSVSH